LSGIASPGISEALPTVEALGVAERDIEVPTVTSKRTNGSGVLAAPAMLPTPPPTRTVEPPARYPLHLRARRSDGSPVAGVEIALSDSEGEDVVATCTTGEDGRCAVDLPSGVYQVRLGGEVDGHPVDPVGDVNVEAMESEREEYYFGPLAVWHDPPHSTQGFVLTLDDEGVLQPLMDADPTGDVPQPVNPMERVREEATPAPGETAIAPAPTATVGQTAPPPEVSESPSPTVPAESPEGPSLFLGGLLCLLGIVAIGGIYYLSRQIRKWRGI
jgi:hypothetical protein